MGTLYNRAVPAIHQVWPSRCILMSAKYNDVCPLHDANIGRMSIMVKSPIRFASDMTVWSGIIVLGMIDKLLTGSCLLQLLFRGPSFHSHREVLRWIGSPSERFVNQREINLIIKWDIRVKGVRHPCFPEHLREKWRLRSPVKADL